MYERERDILILTRLVVMSRPDRSHRFSCSTVPMIVFFTFLHFFIHIMNITIFNRELRSQTNTSSESYQQSHQAVEVETLCLVVDLCLPLLAFFGQTILLFLALFMRFVRHSARSFHFPVNTNISVSPPASLKQCTIMKTKYFFSSTLLVLQLLSSLSLPR